MELRQRCIKREPLVVVALIRGPLVSVGPLYLVEMVCMIFSLSRAGGLACHATAEEVCGPVLADVLIGFAHIALRVPGYLREEGNDIMPRFPLAENNYRGFHNLSLLVFAPVTGAGLVDTGFVFRAANILPGQPNRIASIVMLDNPTLSRTGQADTPGDTPQPSTIVSGGIRSVASHYSLAC